MNCVFNLTLCGYLQRTALHETGIQHAGLVEECRELSDGRNNPVGVGERDLRLPVAVVLLNQNIAENPIISSSLLLYCVKY